MEGFGLKQIVPAVFVLGMNQVDIEGRGLVIHVRALFGIAQCLCLCGALLVYQKIVSAKDTGAKVEVPAVKALGQEMKPACTMTIQEYDLSKWKEWMNQLVMGSIICAGMHYKWGYVVPLSLQVVMTPYATYENNLSKVYLRGMAAQGNMKRPWASANPFQMPDMDALKKAGKPPSARDAKESKTKAALEAKKDKARSKKS